MSEEGTPHVAYRAVLLAAGLLLFGLLFRQLVTLLLAILITIVAFTAGGGARCTRAAALHGAPGVAGVSCPGGAAGRPPSNNR